MSAAATGGARAVGLLLLDLLLAVVLLRLGGDPGWELIGAAGLVVAVRAAVGPGVRAAPRGRNS